MKRQVGNDKGLSHPHCLIDTGATAHLQQAPSHYFLNSFWDRSDNSSPQNISFCDISGTDVAKENCQHSIALCCLTLGAGAHELQILHWWAAESVRCNSSWGAAGLIQNKVLNLQAMSWLIRPKWKLFGKSLIFPSLLDLNCVQCKFHLFKPNNRYRITHKD